MRGGIRCAAQKYLRGGHATPLSAAAAKTAEGRRGSEGAALRRDLAAGWTDLGARRAEFRCRCSALVAEARARASTQARGGAADRRRLLQRTIPCRSTYRARPRGERMLGPHVALRRHPTTALRGRRAPARPVRSRGEALPCGSGGRGPWWVSRWAASSTSPFASTVRLLTLPRVMPKNSTAAMSSPRPTPRPQTSRLRSSWPAPAMPRPTRCGPPSGRRLPSSGCRTTGAPLEQRPILRSAPRTPTPRRRP